MKDTNVTQLVQPGEFEDPLSEIVRNGARSMLAQAIEIEAEQFLSAHAHLTTDDGYQRLVRAWFGMAICRSGKFRPGLVLSLSKSHVCVTDAVLAMTGLNTPLLFCRPISGARKALMN